MEVKRNVRMRRMERIKQLLGDEREQSKQEDFFITPIHEPDHDLLDRPTHVMENPYIDKPVLEKPLPELERSGPSIMPSLQVATDPRLQDPEYVWKQKYKKGLFGTTDEDDWNEHPKLRRFWIKGAICLILFALIWGLFQIQHPYADKGKNYVINALTTPLEFDSVASWFKDTFGDTPSFLPAFDSAEHGDNTMKASTGNKRTFFAPLQGYVTIPFDQSKTGVLLQTKTKAPVSSFDEGQVVFVDTTEETGLTVVIKHPNGVSSTYGWLEQSRVVVNDWVKGGDTIGYASENELKGTGILYFSIKLDKTYVNPVEVVSFD